MKPQNLTGIWHGLYCGGGGGEHVSFVATLLETATFVSGATHEPRAVGGAPGDILFATLMGHRSPDSVRFTKSYDMPDESYSVVEYEGTLSTDGMEIDGRWRIPGNCSGTFLMIRSTPPDAMQKRTADTTIDA